MQAAGGEDRLRRLPLALEFAPGAAEARGRQERDVVVPGDDEQGRSQRAQEAGGGLVLGPAPTVGQVARGEHERRVDPRHELRDRSLDLGLMKGPPRPDMQVRDMEDAC